MIALKIFLFALSCTVAVAQEASQLLPSVLKPAGINMEAVAPTPRRLSVQMDTAALRVAMADWCADPTTAEVTHGHISDWDVSGVTDMSNLILAYCQKNTFNEDISAWDVSAVTTMSLMFAYASSFNQPLSGWDVSAVTTMQSMFAFASSFNQVLCWDVTAVMNTAAMFDGSSGSMDDSCSAGPVGTCFHGATQVTFEDKTTKAMTELQVGDKIQTADILGNLDFAPIISLPHKAGNSEMATFLKIVTDSGKFVQMTPGHLIPNCAGKMFSAKEVVVGDCVMTVDGKEAVTEITSATHFGVYTAVTAHSLIVANGVIASPYSVENDPHHHNDGVPSSFVYFLNKITAKVVTGLRGAKVE